MTAAQAPSPTDAYRRTARRLRHVHASDPVRLQRSLATLARSCDDGTTRAARSFANAATRNDRVGWSAKPQAEALVMTPAPPRNTRAAESFADMVSDHMTGPVLQFSQREKLLRAATRMGIGRFEANLIIAAVQYRTGRREEIHDAAPAHTTQLSPRAMFLTVAIVQAMIIAGVRWIAS